MIIGKAIKKFAWSEKLQAKCGQMGWGFRRTVIDDYPDSVLIISITTNKPGTNIIRLKVDRTNYYVKDYEFDSFEVQMLFLRHISLSPNELNKIWQYEIDCKLELYKLAKQTGDIEWMEKISSELKELNNCSALVS
ncbi:hypothetical protein P8825_14425 [Shouchella clausii]|uniref:hypothetical protein n=1 Tax=Shouchella clausii TaxID=79880 RepID=UPI002DBA0D1A|nr:hypothetical protein [Shouchella clausii]MEB5480760.1 hypothetical protein [Shouchella clausii]